MPNPVHRRRLARIQKGKVETVETVPTTGIITDVQTFDEYTKEELDDKTKDVVIEIAEKLELDIDGSKLKIIERILDNYNSITEEDEEDEENNEN